MIDGIIKGLTQQTGTVEKREHHAVRASHAKSSACVIGELTVPDALPEELAQGLFAQGCKYPVAIRFAQGPGETLGDRVSTHRRRAFEMARDGTYRNATEIRIALIREAMSRSIGI